MDALTPLLSSIETERISLPRKTILLSEGEIAKNLYLIHKGCLRLFFYHEGKDISFQFFFEGDCVASFESLHRASSSSFSLETIEPSTLSVIDRQTFYDLLGRDIAYRRMYEEKLIDRLCTYQLLFLSRIQDSPQVRYEKLLRESPHILQRIPQHYIASYLGITPVSLSRIRSRR